VSVAFLTVCVSLSYSVSCQLDPPPKEPLYVVAHSNVFLYLHEYSDVENLDLGDLTDHGVKCILSDSLCPQQTNIPRTFGDQFYWLDVPK
jgi:ribonuclease Z